MSSRICLAKLYVGAGLEDDTGLGARHRIVIDTREVWDVVEKATDVFPGATITKARGRWEGRGEPSLVVEVWDKASKCASVLSRATTAARTIVKKLDQYAVAIVTWSREGHPAVTYVTKQSGKISVRDHSIPRSSSRRTSSRRAS